MKNTLTLAKVFLLELIREKLLVVGIALSIALSLLGMALGNLSFDEKSRIIFHLSLTALHLVSLGLAVVFGATVLSKEIEKQTCLLVLIRPVSRSQFYIGKFLAISGLILIFQFLVSIVIGLLLLDEMKIPSYLMIFSGFYLEIGLILAATLLASVVIRPSIALFFGVGFFLIGNWIPEFEYFSSKSESPIFKLIGSTIRVWFPNLYRLNWRSFAVMNEPIATAEYLNSMIHGFCWLGLLLLAGTLLWKRRDLV